MNGPTDPDQPGQPGAPDGRSEPDQAREAWLFRLVRTALAPPVLEDGGHDAPLSPRGRLLFWGTVVVLVLGIGVLFVVTAVR